ncbi:MAG: hypothetical protein R2764_14415 [Bacteroidales bacterium]
MKIFLSLSGILLAVTLWAQPSVSDTSMSIPMFYITYMYQFPGGDLAERYGNSSSIGGGFQWKTDKNWIVGIEYTYLFGQDVKISDQIMENIKTEDGNIISMAGTYASFHTYERGYYVSARFGKLIPVLSPNPNSGFVIMGSLGYFQHKIRIEVADNSAPQLMDDYKKGYDRLTGGFGISEQLGYLFLSNSHLWNFYLGVEFNQAWTAPLRDVNFDTGKPDEILNRFDSMIGIKAAWFIPIFKRLPQKYYYY